MTTMRKKLTAIIICISCYLTSFPILADGWNLGFKLAYFQPDGINNADDPDNAGLIIGYDWIQDYGVVGLESDLTTTYIDGDFSGQDITVDTAGIHVTYKTTGNSKGLGFYFKLKAGATYFDLNTSGPLSNSDVEASVGLGIGINMGTLAFELEYATINDGEIVSFVVLF